MVTPMLRLLKPIITLELNEYMCANPLMWYFLLRGQFTSRNVRKLFKKIPVINCFGTLVMHSTKIPEGGSTSKRSNAALTQCNK